MEGASTEYIYTDGFESTRFLMAFFTVAPMPFGMPFP